MTADQNRDAKARFLTFAFRLGVSPNDLLTLPTAEVERLMARKVRN